MLSLLMPPIVQLVALLLLVVACIALCVWVVRATLDAMGEPVEEPREKLIDQLGRVLSPMSNRERGKVIVFGEIWDALSADASDGERIEKGVEIRVVGFDRVDPRVLHVTRQLLGSPQSSCPSPPEE